MPFQVACCWHMAPHELIDKCAAKVAAGEADAILSDRIGLTSWLLGRQHPERCTNFTFSSGVIVPYGNPRQVRSPSLRCPPMPFDALRCHTMPFVIVAFGPEGRADAGNTRAAVRTLASLCLLVLS